MGPAQVFQFYDSATDAELSDYESALDNGDVGHARQIIVEHASKKQAARQGFLDEPPKPGDLVYVQHTDRYGTLETVSEDGTLAVVNSWFGPYTVPYNKLHRIR